MAFFTDTQLESFSDKLSRTNIYVGLHKEYLRYNPESVKYNNARQAVLDFIRNFLIIEADLTNPNDTINGEVLDYYDRTYALDYVYNLLPDNVRLYLDPDLVIKNLFRIYTEERNYFTTLIKRLPLLHDPFVAPEEYLDLIAKAVGLTVDYSLPADVKRFMIFRAIPWYKIKGTTKAFNITFRSMGLDASVIELWTNYDQTRMDTEPEVWPSINGEINPAYDPTDTTDDVIKYKSSFFDLEISTSAAVDPDVVAKAIERLEDVRPITRTLRRIKFTVDLNDGEDLEPDPDNPSGESASGFPLPNDENFSIDATKDFLDEFPYVQAKTVTYGGDGFGPFYYNSFHDCVYDGSCLYGDYDSAYYHYDGGLMQYDGTVLYDNSEDISYAGSATLYYDAKTSESDILDIVVINDLEDSFASVKTYYNNDPLSVDPLTYSNESGLTYGNSLGADDFLEIEAYLEEDFEDTIDMSDEGIAVVIPSVDETDRVSSSTYYDGDIFYSQGITYGSNPLITYNNEYVYDGTILYADAYGRYDGEIFYEDEDQAYYNNLAIFGGDVTQETDPLELYVSTTDAGAIWPFSFPFTTDTPYYTGTVSL